MAEFSYTARNAEGRSEKGAIEARDKRAAIAMLQARGLVPIQVQPKTAGSSVAAPPLKQATDASVSAPIREKPLAAPSGAPKGNAKLGLLFAKRLLDLHSGGLSMGDSVFLLHQRLTDPRLRAVASEVWTHLREGKPFARAVEQVKGLYSRSMVCLFEAGEASGDMVSVLKNSIEYLEERQRIRRHVAASMAYPFFVIGVVFVLLLMFLFFMMPRIQTMIDSMGGRMNFFTQVLVWLAETMVKSGPFVVIGIVVVSVLVAQWRRMEKGRLITDRWFLRIPLLGRISWLSTMYQTSNLMHTLLGSGINTTEMLKLTERTISNLWIRQRFSDARTKINEGMSFSNAFRLYQLYPDDAIDILSVGENTGNLARGLQEITSSMRAALSERIRLLTVSISAAAMGTAFVLVLFVALGMILSVYEVTHSIGRH